MREADVYYDPTHKNLLYVAESNGRLLKVAVEINYKVKKIGTVNAVVTAGVITRTDLSSAGYEKIVW